MTHLVKFGNFILDCSNDVLYEDESPVHLTPLATKLLKYLITNRHQCLSTGQLAEKVWEASSVSPNTIQQQIAEIRRVLKDSADQPRFIETKRKRGWQFIAEVEDIVDPLAVPEESSASRFSLSRWLFIPAALAGAVLAGLFVIQITNTKVPRVLSAERLSNDGEQKIGPLFSDRTRVFFVEMKNGSSSLASIPLVGGEPTLIPLPLSDPQIMDMSADRSTLLLRSGSSRFKLWTYSVTRKELLQMEEGFSEAARSNRGNIALFDPGSLSLVVAGQANRKIHLPGILGDMRWSPNGKQLRLSMLDKGRESMSEWEVTNDDWTLRRLPLQSDGPRIMTSGGSWSRDGRYFYYQSGEVDHQDLWVRRESPSMFRRSSDKAWRLTTGEPGSWEWPSTSEDESVIYAINSAKRTQLVRYDSAARAWKEHWNGAPFYQLDYSRDGQWVAYSYFRDHTIWKSHPDGTHRILITPPGMDARLPHWSPDSKWIGFMGKNKHDQWRAFVVSATGGSPAELWPSNEEQGGPSWSADGRYVVFGDLLGRKSGAEMSIHLLDLRKHKIADLQNSKGLWSPRWSPDGSFIAATTSDFKAIKIARQAGGQWLETARMRALDNVTWSADSRYLLFDGQYENGKWAFFRVSIEGIKTEIVPFDRNWLEEWSGVAADGSLLAFRAGFVQEIYALKCSLP